MALLEDKKIMDLDSPQTDPTRTRREFLTWGIYAVSAGVGLVVAVPTVGYFIAPATKSDTQKVLAAVGNVADLANQTTLLGKTLKDVKYIESFKESTITKKVFVRALKENASAPADFLVLDSTCTHAGCAVAYQQATSDLYCGCHGSRFDNLGNVTHAPAPKPLNKYDVIVEGGQVKINIFQSF
jgi:menaquinol-cytochrome c reductase iron-sulfur subunit